MKKLPRLWDEKYTTPDTPDGEEEQRYCIESARSDSGQSWMVWDNKREEPVWDNELDCSARWFRTRKAAENWLKKTTVRAWKVQQVEKKLDRGAA
jgi:hypothetical protein